MNHMAQAKRFSVLLAAAASVLLCFAAAMAQTEPERLERLQVSFWPDFDRPSVLVLLTGELPDGATLPAEIMVPIPADAQLNAVAAIDEQGMLTIDFEQFDDHITFVTDQLQFRVEYYAPYEEDGLARAFDFSYVSPVPISELDVEIQQPANAISLGSTPEATEVFTNEFDNLAYHALAVQVLPPGTAFELSFDYEMRSEGLTAGQMASVPGAPQPEMVEQSSSLSAGVNDWLLLAGVLGLVALAVASTWFLATREKAGRGANRPGKPAPKREKAEIEASVYCHICGTPAAEGDQYCRNCGTRLKRSL